METFVKLDEGAILPTRAHPTDTGYDLHIIRAETVENNTVNDTTTVKFDTGVHIRPPKGYYFDVVPRSSFSKLGLTFANSVGVIDDTYTGSIKLVVTGKQYLILEYTQQCKLPVKWFQLILRKREDCLMTVVGSLEDTERGSSGFGSTG